MGLLVLPHGGSGKSGRSRVTRRGLRPSTPPYEVLPFPVLPAQLRRLKCCYKEDHQVRFLRSTFITTSKEKKKKKTSTSFYSDLSDERYESDYRRHDPGKWKKKPERKRKAVRQEASGGHETIANHPSDRSTVNRPECRGQD